MVANLATLYYLTGNDDHRWRAEKTIDVFARQPFEQYINMTSILNGFEKLTKTIQVTVFGEVNAPETKAMRAMANLSGHPDLVLSLIPPGCKLPLNHPAADKNQINGVVTAYVCVGTSCSLPVTTPVGLKNALAEA